VLELHRLICGGLMPDITLLLLPDLAASLKRARRRNDKHTAKTGTDESRFEREQDVFFERVHAKYVEIAAREPARVVAIDGNLDIDAVHERVITAVSARLEAWQVKHKMSA
jgi:dTMP kinase